MWNAETIEAYTATLTEHERIVLDAASRGRDLQDIKDTAFIILGSSYDEDYVDHLYSMITHPETVNK